MFKLMLTYPPGKVTTTSPAPPFEAINFPWELYFTLDVPSIWAWVRDPWRSIFFWRDPLTKTHHLDWPTGSFGRYALSSFTHLDFPQILGDFPETSTLPFWRSQSVVWGRELIWPEWFPIQRSKRKTAQKPAPLAPHLKAETTWLHEKKGLGEMLPIYLEDHPS